MDVNKLDSHYSHFHFIRHYALVTFFYACICSPCVINEVREGINQLRGGSINYSASPVLFNNNSVIDQSVSLEQKQKIDAPINTFDLDLILNQHFSKSGEFSEIVKNLEKDMTDSEENFKILLKLFECLAHSFKLIFYVLFSTHLKCHFKFVRARKLNGSII